LLQGLTVFNVSVGILCGSILKFSLVLTRPLVIVPLVNAVAVRQFRYVHLFDWENLIPVSVTDLSSSRVMDRFEASLGLYLVL
jgi:hypothetical protein